MSFEDYEIDGDTTLDEVQAYRDMATHDYDVLAAACLSRFYANGHYADQEDAKKYGLLALDLIDIVIDEDPNLEDPDCVLTFDTIDEIREEFGFWKNFE